MRDPDRGHAATSSIATVSRHPTQARPRPPRLMRHPGLFTLVRVLGRRLVLHVAIVAVLVLTLVGGELTQPPPRPLPPAPTMPSPAEVLIVQNGCWTGQAPPGVEARHAVVMLPGQPARLVPAGVGFDIWLGPDGKSGTGDERPGTLYAFCP